MSIIQILNLLIKTIKELSLLHGGKTHYGITHANPLLQCNSELKSPTAVNYRVVPPLVSLKRS
jgi:hypothetical protein